MKKELDVAIKAAKEAGEILKENFRQDHLVTLKEDKSFVTKIDRAAEQKIISVIKADFPDHSINAEESGFSEKLSEYLWLVDPLDGTTNYTTHLPFFSVSIALSKLREVQIGVVYDPTSDNLYTAEKGKGASLNSSTIRVSATSEMGQSMIGYARPKKGKEKFVDIFSKVELATRTPKILGSMALHLCLVASGVMDAAILISPNPWDAAAGSILVEEAGGKVTDFEGKPWSIDSKDILATNGKIHEEILKIINS